MGRAKAQVLLLLAAHEVITSYEAPEPKPGPEERFTVKSEVEIILFPPAIRSSIVHVPVMLMMRDGMLFGRSTP